MKILPIGSDPLKAEGSKAGGLQTKSLHGWRLETLEKVRSQKAAGVTKDALWKELSVGANIGQRKILSKVLTDEFK